MKDERGDSTTAAPKVQEEPFRTHYRARLKKLTRFMARRSPVRLWIERRRLDEKMAVPGELLTILEAARPMWGPSHTSALSTLAAQDLMHDDVRRLRTLLSGPRAASSRLYVDSGCAVVGVVAFIGYLALVAGAGAIFASDRGELVACAAFALLFSALCVVLAVEQWCRRNLRMAATAAMERHGGPECLDALRKAFTTQRSACLPLTRAALLAVLGRIGPEDYGRLPGGSEKELINLITISDDEVARGSLNALRAAGSGASAAAVGHVAKAARDGTTRALASDVLPALLERQRNETASSTLLRAGHASATGDLLRASVEQEVRTDELLRASVEE